MLLGLLPLLKSIQKHCTLKRFAGQTIGVDAYGWLHRGVVGCAFALALDKPTTIHIDFVLSRVRMLLDFGVTPYLIFDGDNLPSKAGTNDARRRRREECKTLGLELHRAGKSAQAQQELQKAVDVTPLMARQLIEELKKLDVPYIVAPYEADAQLVYLEQKGIIDGILSEDSDLLVFGAKRLLTKLNQYGELVEVMRADFTLCKEISLAGWTDSMFMRMAILSGCDYLPNIGKIGLKTAHAYVRKYKDIEKILRVIQFEAKLIVPANYLEDFRHAESTFLHHRVFCPVAQKMVCLKELGPGMTGEDMPFLGPYVEPDIAIGVASGDLDPFSKKPIQLQQNKSSARPALGENRRQSYATPTELKTRKSIETFFKPQRQPLAELDPNSLTPSPSQQRVLDLNRNMSWEPRVVASAPALRHGATFLARSSVATDRSAFLARASTMSTYQPPKRQRLCSESMDSSPILEVQRSPFFCSNVEESSPLAGKKIKVKKGRRSGFEVFSDDGAQKEADLEGVAGQKSPLVQAKATSQRADTPEAILQSSPLTHPFLPGSAQPFKDTSPSKRPSVKCSPPKPAKATEISQDHDPEAFEDLLEWHVRKQNEALLKTFVFQPAEEQASALRSLASTQTHPKAFSTQSPKTSVADDYCPPLDLQKTFSYQCSEVQQSALKSLGMSQAGKEGGRVGANSGQSRSDHPSKTNLVEKGITSSIHTAEVRGSEDAIVPTSDEECSDVGSPARRPRLDLSSFAFVAT